MKPLGHPPDLYDSLPLHHVAEASAEQLRHFGMECDPIRSPRGDNRAEPQVTFHAGMQVGGACQPDRAQQLRLDAAAKGEQLRHPNGGWFPLPLLFEVLVRDSMADHEPLPWLVASRDRTVE